MADVASITTGLVPAFVAGFAVQQLLELLDPIISRITKSSGQADDLKKSVMNVIAIGFAAVITFGSDDIRILSALGIKPDPWFDGVVTMFVISAGTNGVNSILKFMSYKKEEAKVDAANKATAVNAQGMKEIDRHSAVA